MRRSMIPFLVLLTLVVTNGCKGRNEAPSPTTTTTTTITTTTATTTATTGTTATSGTRTASGPPPVTIDMTIAGLATVADASVTPNEKARKTIILANQSGHQAMFIMKASNIDTTSKDFHEIGTIGKTKYYAFYLDGEQIELANDTWDGGSSLDFSDWGIKENATQPADLKDAQQRSSLQWVPDLSRVLGQGSFPPLVDYFAHEPLPSNVAARMPLRGGQLASHLLDPIWIWRFRNVNGYSDQKQVMVSELHYTFPLKSGESSFKIYGRKFAPTGTPQAPAPLFTVTAPKTDTVIEMFFANIPQADFTKTVKIDLQYVDPHFHQHFKMLKGAPEYDAVIVDTVKTPPSKPLTKLIYCGPVAVQ